MGDANNATLRPGIIQTLKNIGICACAVIVVFLVGVIVGLRVNAGGEGGVTGNQAAIDKIRAEKYRSDRQIEALRIGIREAERSNQIITVYVSGAGADIAESGSLTREAIERIDKLLETP